jgi:hypothetical protein
MSERTVGKLLKKLGFRKLSARPAHPKGDVQARETFKNVWPAPSARGDFSGGVVGLHQRIRSQGRTLAKMDIRAPRSS